MSRRTAREEAVKIIYQMEIHKDQDPIDYFLQQTTWAENDVAFVKNMVAGVFDHHADVTQVIVDNATNWPIHRISKMNLSILRLALYEMIYEKDIPRSVSINEAVELAKKYDGPEAGAFVNGVLGAAISTMGEEV
ncbi:MAG: transcription antitermination factor NusB [Hyphomonadaceae bacterium]|nr:transcription antitermination factor NusB [Clostridia bacterium]